MIEYWQDIKNYENYYQISNLGRVKSLPRKGTLKTEKILKNRITSKGYNSVMLSKNGKTKVFYIHRLVAETFIPNPNNLPQVNHKDGNKLNNCIENLEWVTDKENKIHAKKYGLITSKYGTDNNNSKLSMEDIQYIRNHYIPKDKNFGVRALALKYNISHSSISRIVNNKSYIMGN